MDRFPPDPSLPTDVSMVPPVPPPTGPPPKDTDARDSFNFAFLKGPKRKRLAKACDACHKSKRRCDGTAPCSNCYFASKDCTYTDASGRAVPAPRISKPDKPGSPSESRRRPPHSAKNHQRSSVPVAANSSPANGSGYSDTHSAEPSTSRLSMEAADEYQEARKRPRVASVSESYRTPDPQPTTRMAAVLTFPTSRLDLPVVRELVNLFFAHCHPERLFIHQPTFLAALAHNGVPTYLQYAICARAAPLSKQPVVRTKPPRIAGNAYATQAISEMFDKSGRLVVQRNLATVQALCLLQSHELVTAWPWTSSTKYFELALKILEEDLHVLKQNNNPVLTPVPTPAFVFEAIERECARRAFWYIRLMYLPIFPYYNVPVPPKPLDLTLRLPVDETSFEFGAHSTLSEYLHVPAPRTPYASEYGHLVRVASIASHLETTLRAGETGSIERGAIDAMVQDSERALTAWDASLADHLRFGEESAQLQMAMFETGANAGAWCYFMMHVIHASCILALCDAKYRLSGVTAPDCRQWARERLMLIPTSLGGRAKNSILQVAVLLTLQKHDLAADHVQVEAWTREHEETWGMKLPQLSAGSSRPSSVSSVSSPEPRAQPAPPFTTAASTTASSSSGGPDFSTQHDDDRSEASSTSSAAYYRSLGRAYNKLRLTERSPPPSPELFLQPSIREFGAPAAMPQTMMTAGAGATLPSLKACGLLDSWGPPEASASANGMSPSPSELPPPPWKTLLAQTSALKASSSTGTGAVAGAGEMPPPSPRAPGNSTMPVGLHWLENER